MEKKDFKRFSELSTQELEKLDAAQKLRAEKKNRDLLDGVRCVWTGHHGESKKDSETQK